MRFRHKEFHDRKAGGKTKKRIQRRQLGWNVVNVDTEALEKGRENLYLWGMEGLQNPSVLCEVFKLGCEPRVYYKTVTGLSGVLAITAVMEDAGRHFANGVWANRKETKSEVILLSVRFCSEETELFYFFFLLQVHYWQNIKTLR